MPKNMSLPVQFLIRHRVEPCALYERLAFEVGRRTVGKIAPHYEAEIVRLKDSVERPCVHDWICGEWIYDEVYDYVFVEWKRREVDAVWVYLLYSVIARDAIWGLVWSEPEREAYRAMIRGAFAQAAIGDRCSADSLAEFQSWIDWLGNAGRAGWLVAFLTDCRISLGDGWH